MTGLLYIFSYPAILYMFSDCKPMTPSHKETLRQNHVKLIENMHCQMVTQYLRSKFILTDYDADRIRSKDVQVEAGRLLLDILIKKSDSAFLHLVDALNSQSVNQKHLANLLYVKCKSTIYRDFHQTTDTP